MPSYEHLWSLPPTESPHTTFSFLGGNITSGKAFTTSSGDSKSKVGPCLAVACADSSFYLFDPLRRRLSDWSRDVGLPSAAKLPRELIRSGCGERTQDVSVKGGMGGSSAGEYVTGVAFNPGAPNKFLLVSHGFFCAVDLDRPVPQHAAHFPPRHVRARRKRANKRAKTASGAEGDAANAAAAGDNFTLCLRYSGVLFLDFCGEDEMVVVERPWRNVVADLPEALERRVYGVN